MLRKKRIRNSFYRVYVLFGLVSLSILNACAPAEREEQALNKYADPTQRMVADLIDQRQVERVIPYLDTSDAAIRLTAVIGAGSLQDSLLIPPLAQCLDDSLTDIRKAAAFALGQTRNAAAYSVVSSQLENEQSLDVKKALWISAGKTVPEDQSQILINRIADAPCNEESTWGLYQLSLRGLITDTVNVNKLLHFLNCEQPEARQAFAQFLARTRDLDLSPFRSQMINVFENEDDPETKIALALCFRHCGNIHGNDLLRLISVNTDERIQQNLLRSGWSTGVIEAGDMIEILTDHHPLISYSAAEWMAQQEWDENLTEKVELELDEVSDRVRPKLLKGLVKNSSDPDRFVDQIVEAIGLNDGNPYLQGDYIRALEYSSNAISYIIAHMDASLPAPLSTASAETILNIHRSGNWPKNISFSAVAKDAFESQDEAILALFGAYIREAQLHDFEEITWLENAAEQLSLPRQIETYNVLLLSIQYLRGEEQEPYTLPTEHPIDWELIQQIPIDQIARITTVHGNIDIKLYVEETPGTVGSFVSLIQSGFYDGKYVHRVVPNFVIQSGCPRGDGYGSVDYAIRSEFTARPYTSGSVGMASAGKDTESCQWFITHSPTPHLEGRYTQFAKVIKGLDAVRKIQQGDEIIKIKLVDSGSDQGQ